MFPNLSYIANYFFGTPVDNGLSIIQTFGLFLIFAFLFSFFLFQRELKWREKVGIISGVKTLGSSPKKEIPSYMLVLNFVFGFMIGAKVLQLINRSASESISDLLFSFQGSFVGGLVGSLILGGGGLYIYLSQKENSQKEIEYPSDYAIELTILSAISGIIGAKLFSVAENLPAFFANPIKTLFSGSGLTIYGGLITAFIVGYFYMKKKGFKVLSIMDALSPALLLGYMLGRFGCHFSGDGDWGKVNRLEKPLSFIPDWLWSWKYPHNVVNSARESILMEDCGGLISSTGNPPIYCRILPEGVFPTPLYEIIICGLILVFILVIKKRVKTAGLIFFIYLLLTGVERFVIEFVRVNERYELLGLGWSFSQWIALIMSLIGLVFCFILIPEQRKSSTSSS